MTDRILESHPLDELNIEEIAKIGDVIVSESKFIVSDNIGSEKTLDRDYIDSIGSFKVGAPFKIKFTMLMFCVKGKMEVQLNLSRLTLNAGEMLIVFEGAVAMGLEMDPGIQLFIIGFTQNSADFHPHSRMGISVFSNLKRSPLVKLTETELNEIHSIYRVMKSRMAMPGFTAKDDLAWSGLEMIACVISDKVQRQSEEITGALTRKQLIVRNFIRLVGQSAYLHRDISYYARELCISAKYLGQIVSAETGESPREWICRQVVLEAKALLDDPTLTVQQVSETLHFPNQSFFGTFFRNNTGLSPKAYRQRISNKSE